MSEITEKILDAVEVIVNKEINSAKYDKTIQATILSCVDAQIGKYKVRYQGSSFYAFASDVSITFKDGISVYILIPEGDFTKVKTILGTVQNLGQSVNTIITEDQRYEEIGIDCIIDTENSKIQLDKNNSSIVLLENNFLNNNYIKEVLQSEFQLNVNLYKAFLFKATFQTEIGNILSDIEYGLRITCSIGENVTNTYVLSSTNMQGNPLNYGIPINQTRYFRPTEDIEKIIKIEAYATGLQENDKIYINNLVLIPCRYLTNNEITTKRLVIKKLNGSSFTESINSLRVEAELRENNSIVALDKDNVSYKWFIEHPDTLPDSIDNKEYYSEYAGSGWYLLGETSGEVPYFDFIKEYFHQQKRQIKCILEYKPKDSTETTAIYSAETNLYNLDESSIYSDDTFIILKGTSDSTIQEQATEHLFTGDNEQIWVEAKSNINNVTVHWVYKDIENNYYRPNNINTQEANPILIESILLNGNVRTYIACFYDNNGILMDWRTFYVGFKTEQNKQYDVTILNGDKTYIYNENGLAPTQTSDGQIIMIKELSVNMIDLENPTRVITSQDIAGVAPDNITWYIVANPNERLIAFDKKMQIKEDNDGVENIGGIDYIAAYGPTLSYTLENSYKTNANSNIIKIKIKYNGDEIWAQTNIQCYKVGDPGLINGQYYIDVIQCDNLGNNENINYYNTIEYYINDTSEDPNIKQKYQAAPLNLKVRVWNGIEWINDFSVNWEMLNTFPRMTNDQKKQITSFIELNNINSTIVTCNPISLSSFETSNPNIVNNNICNLFRTIYVENGKTSNIGTCQLLRVSVTIEDKTYYRTVPIAVVFKSASLNDYNINLIDNSGFKYVKYNSAGNNPIYDTSAPFRIGIFNKEDKLKSYNIAEDTENNLFSFEWEYVNGAYDTVTRSIVDINLFKGEENKNTNKYKISINSSQEISGYLFYFTGVMCSIKQNSNILAYFYFPIDIYKSLSDNSIVSGWDGHSLKMNDGKDGKESYLMSNMIGAGAQETNGFTGVLMGEIADETADNEKKQKNATGIMAYKDGDRTFFLDASDGSATFGSAVSGQIKIQPGNEKESAYISSGVKSIDNPDNSSGMTINFSQKPSIEFHNGKFLVDSNGRLTAKEANIEGNFAAGQWNEEGYGSKVNVSTNLSSNEGRFSLEAKTKAPKNASYKYERSSISNTGFSFGCYNDKDEMTQGITYSKGKLIIKGELKATIGTIGGWKIEEDCIRSAEGSLILYSNGRIVGFNANNSKDTSSNLLDISNSGIDWKTPTTKTWEDIKNSFTSQSSIKCEDGSISINSSGQANIQGGTGLSLYSQGCGINFIKDESIKPAINAIGFTIKDYQSIRMGSLTSKSKSEDAQGKTLFCGYQTFFSTYDQDSSQDIMVRERKKEQSKTATKDNGEKVTTTIINDIGESNISQIPIKLTKKGTKYIAEATTENDAVQYWYANPYSLNIDTQISKFNNVSENYVYKKKNIQVPKAYAVSGRPPIKASIKKNNKGNYIIKEEYPAAALGLWKSEDGTNPFLEYEVVMEKDQVKSIIFPNKLEMKLEGFENVLKVNCPYKGTSSSK